MSADSLQRALFVIAMCVLGLSTALGIGYELWRSGQLPGLTTGPLIDAQVAYDGSDPRRLAEEARALTAIQPRKRGGFMMLGRALAQSDRVDEAIAAYQQALQLGPDGPLAHAQLARLYYRRGDLAQARLHVRMAQSLQVSFDPSFLRAVGADGSEG